jgi:hypothetical protein
MWNCCFMMLLFLYDKFFALQQCCIKNYKRLETYVLNDTFIQIKFYNIETQDTFILYNNAWFIRMLFLGILKGLFRYSIIHRYTHLKYILKDHNMEDVDPNVYPIMEVVYYRNGITKRYFSKGIRDSTFITELLRNKHPAPAHKYLHASISEKYNITKFLHEHMDSFTEENEITVEELYHLYKMVYNIEEEDKLEEVYCKLIEDDTLDEYTLNDNDIIAIAGP